MIDSLRRLGLWPADRGHFRSVGRIVLLAGLVGVVAGLGAVAFQFLSLSPRKTPYAPLEQLTACWRGSLASEVGKVGC